MIDLDAIFLALATAFQQRFGGIIGPDTYQTEVVDHEPSGGSGYVISRSRHADCVAVIAPIWRLEIDGDGVVWWPKEVTVLFRDEADALALALVHLARRHA